MSNKISLRFTLPVWGEKYIDIFLNLALKSLFTEEAKNILRDNFNTKLAIYTNVESKTYFNNSSTFQQLSAFIDSVIFENEAFENSSNLLDCYNIYNPKIIKNNHIFHQFLKHSLKKSLENNSYNLLILPEFLYSKNFLSTILFHIMSGKELILYHQLRVPFDKNTETCFLNVLEKDNYINENLIFEHIDNMRGYTDYFHSLNVGIPNSWKGYHYKFNNSKNIHLKTFNTIYAAINPKNLTNLNNDIIECYASDYWSIVDEAFKNSANIAVMSKLSEGCAFDFENPDSVILNYKELNKNYTPANNKFLVYLKSFTSYYPYRVNAFFDYTYSVDIEKDKMDSELKFVNNSLKNLYPFRTYSKVYHFIRKYIEKIMHKYVNKKFLNKVKSCKNKDVVLIGNGKFIIYLLKQTSILKELKIKYISILDYNNYYSDDIKLYGIKVIKPNELCNLNAEEFIFFKINNDMINGVNANKIELFKYKFEYNFVSLIFKAFKLFYIRA